MKYYQPYTLAAKMSLAPLGLFYTTAACHKKSFYKNTASPLKLHKWLIKPKTAEHYSVVCSNISLVWPGTTVQPRVLYPIMQWSYCARIQTVSLLLSDSPDESFSGLQRCSAALLSSYPASSTKWTQPLMTRNSWDSNCGPLGSWTTQTNRPGA